MKSSIPHSFHVFLTFAALFGMSACSGGNEVTTPDTPPTPGTDPQPATETRTEADIQLQDDGELLLSEESHNATIHFHSALAWQAAVTDADRHAWIRLSPASGEAGDATLELLIEANEDYDERSAEILLSSEGPSETVRVRLSVNQKQKGALLLTQDHYEVAAEGASIRILAKANAAVSDEIVSGEDWIHILGTKGLSEYEFLYEIDQNSESEARSGSIRFYNSYGSETVRIEQAGAEKEEPDEPTPTPSDNDELDCPNPPTEGEVALDACYGYGAGVTGGQGATAANILHFNNGKALQTWLLARTKAEKKGDHSPVIIWLSGRFGPEDGRDFSSAHPWFDVKDVSNLSFLGTDDFVMDQIGIFCVRAQNIIIRNINFQQPKANNGADAVSMQACDGVWVDHCSFTSLNQTKDYEDGSCDITHASKNVTVSWCHFIKTQKSCLVGHSNSASADTDISVTFHHNWFDASSSRHPRVRFGRAHVYNNFYDGCSTYGAGSAYGARVLVEYNYFDGVQLPTDICTFPAKESGVSNLQGSVAGYLYATRDVFVNKPAKAKSPYPLTNIQYSSYGSTAGSALSYADFQPSYNYVVTPAQDVPEVVRKGAGYGKLTDYAEAPIAVNNGGIDSYNGSDDQPENPDPGNEDDPDLPDDGAAHLYSLSMQSKSLVQTADGVGGASYFDASTSVADFSKDYAGSFTISGTSYSQGLKMDSKGYVRFTTSTQYTSRLRFFAARRKASASGVRMQLIPAEGEALLFDETPHETYLDSGYILLEPGMSYTLKQKSGEQALILVLIQEEE